MTNRWNRKHRRRQLADDPRIPPRPAPQRELPFLERSELENVSRTLRSYDTAEDLTPELMAELVNLRGFIREDLETMAELGMRWNRQTESFWQVPIVGLE